jgi:molybdopterin converting factor small subunit
MRTRFKFHGVFRTAAGTNETIIELTEATPTVRSAVTRLVAQKGFENLKQLLVESETSDPRPNALIMVSGREISTLNGLDTLLNPDDEVTLLPIAHGG